VKVLSRATVLAMLELTSPAAPRAQVLCAYIRPPPAALPLQWTLPE